MITSDFISKVRRKYNDSPIKHEDIISGDGIATVYRSQFFPILEGSFSLYINNVLKTVVNDYTIDYDTGDIVLGATTTYKIKIQYKEVKFRDQQWLESIQDAFDSFGDQFFRSVLRSPSGITLSAGIQVYDCPSDCIRLTEVLASTDYTSAGPFAQLPINHRYDRWSNKLVLGEKPGRGNFMEISYLRNLKRPTTLTETLDMVNSWLELLDLKTGSIFLRSLANRYAQQGNATVEEGHLSIAHLRQLANDNEILFENSKKKIKPVMPSLVIPNYIHGGGTV